MESDTSIGKSRIYDNTIYFVERNPTIIIEIAYHPDQRGSRKYN